MNWTHVHMIRRTLTGRCRHVPVRVVNPGGWPGQTVLAWGVSSRSHVGLTSKQTEMAMQHGMLKEEGEKESMLRIRQRIKEGRPGDAKCQMSLER